MQENNRFGLLCTKQKHRNTEQPKKQNHQNQKNDKKNTFLHSSKPPLFLLNFCFCQATLSHVCKAVFCWKHNKNSVFSEQSF